MALTIETTSSGGAQKPRLHPLTYGILIAAALFALYFAALGRYPLMDPDEPVYGQVAKEMAAGRGWLTPHYLGQPWFDKPPLYYWLSATSASLLGPTELAIRLPSAILAVGLVFLVYALASYDFGRRASVFSAIAMATCLQQIVLAHASVTDMTLVFCLTAALYAYRRWIGASGRARFRWIVLCGAMTGLGMLAKGPVAPVLLAATFTIHLWWTGRLRHLASLEALAGIAAAVAVGAPWYLAMWTLHHDTFVQGFLVANNIVRFLKPEHAEITGHWYSFLLNVPVLLVFFFPWSVFLPQGLVRAWRVNEGARLASVWFAVVFIFFSISKTQLVTYIFPLYPAAAIFVGVLWGSAASGDSRDARGVRSALWAALGISVLVAAGLVMYANAKYPEAARAALVLGAIMVVTVAAALAWTIRCKRDTGGKPVWILGTGMAVFTLWIMCGVMPLAAPRASTRDLVQRIPGADGARIIEMLRSRRQSMVFYLGRRPEHALDASAARRLLSERTPTFVICKEAAAEQLRTPGAVLWAKSGGLVVFANEAAYRKGSKAR